MSMTIGITKPDLFCVVCCQISINITVTAIYASVAFHNSMSFVGFYETSMHVDPIEITEYRQGFPVMFNRLLAVSNHSRLNVPFPYLASVLLLAHHFKAGPNEI